MIPSEYKLDFVVARLIERLEGTRRSFGPADQEEAEIAFSRIAGEHITAALGEFREVALADDPELHASFIEREVMKTFLPRYLPVALEANRLEASGYGLRLFAGPLGRIVIGFLSLMLLILMPRFKMLWLFYPSLPILLTAPFFPDLWGWLNRRKYRRILQEIVADMMTIQSRNDDYEPVSRLRTEEMQSSSSSSEMSAPNKERT